MKGFLTLTFVKVVKDSSHVYFKGLDCLISSSLGIKRSSESSSSLLVHLCSLSIAMRRFQSRPSHNDDPCLPNSCQVNHQLIVEYTAS